jgi:hypothetical protein
MSIAKEQGLHIEFAFENLGLLRRLAMKKKYIK